MTSAAPSRILPSFLLLCLGLATSTWAGAQTARVMSKVGSGPAKIVNGDGAPVEAVAGLHVREKSEIVVAADAELCLEVVPGVVVVVGPNSRVVAERISPDASAGANSGTRQALLNLIAGQVAVLVAASADGAPLFAVRTPSGSLIKARGDAAYAVGIAGGEHAVVVAAGQIEAASTGARPLALSARGDFELLHRWFGREGGRVAAGPHEHGRLRALAGAALLAVNRVTTNADRSLSPAVVKVASAAMQDCLGNFLRFGATTPAELEEVAETLARAAQEPDFVNADRLKFIFSLSRDRWPDASVERIAEALARGGTAWKSDGPNPNRDIGWGWRESDLNIGLRVSHLNVGRSILMVLEGFRKADPQRFKKTRESLAYRVALGAIDGALRTLAGGNDFSAVGRDAPVLVREGMTMAMAVLIKFDPVASVDLALIDRLRGNLAEAVTNVLEAAYRRAGVPMPAALPGQIASTLSNQFMMIMEPAKSTGPTRF